MWAVTAKLRDEDKAFIRKYLNEDERDLFYSIPVYEQVHSLRVARGVLDECLKKNIYDIILIKAGLLHDIGKMNCRMGIITKSILVVMDKIFPTRMRRLILFKKVNVYYNHPELGVDILKTDNEYLKYLIQNHHNYQMKGDEKLDILQKVDSEY